MPINPLIALQGRTPDINQSFSNALLNVQKIDAIKQSREQAPIRQRLLESQTQTSEDSASRAREQAPARQRILEAGATGAEAKLPTVLENLNRKDKNLIRSVSTFSRQALPVLQSGDIEGTRAALQNRRAFLIENNLPTRETDEALVMVDSDPLGLATQMQNSIDLDNHLSGITQKVGLASAKTEILESGATIQSLPSGQVVVKDALGNQVEGQSRRDVLKNAAQVKQDRLQVQAERTVETSRKIEQVKDATATADKAFNLVDNIRQNIDNLEQVVPLVGQGANTGPIISKFPSFKASSVKLDQLQNRLGLDVVGATTFGALSKGELDLAKSTALPVGLKGDDLIVWVNDAIKAKRKLANYYEEQAIFLGAGNSQADWLKKQRADLKELASEVDIRRTMKDNNMSRSQVIQELRRRASNGG